MEEVVLETKEEIKSHIEKHFKITDFQSGNQILEWFDLNVFLRITYPVALNEPEPQKSKNETYEEWGRRMDKWEAKKDSCADAIKKHKALTTCAYRYLIHKIEIFYGISECPSSSIMFEVLSRRMGYTFSVDILEEMKESMA